MLGLNFASSDLDRGSAAVHDPPFVGVPFSRFS